jgi:hypothetical protein
MSVLSLAAPPPANLTSDTGFIDALSRPHLQPRSVLWSRGGCCAFGGPDGSEESAVDRNQVRRLGTARTGTAAKREKA